MKKLLPILFILMCCVAMAAGPVINSYRFAPAAGGNLLSTDFEGTGEPTSWDVGTATPNWDNTSSPLNGAQDLMLDASSTDAAAGLFTATNEVWIKFKVRLSSLGGATPIFLYAGFFSGGVDISLARDSGPLRLMQGASQVAITAENFLVDTTYYVWLHIDSGSGANAVYDVEFSTTDSRTGSGTKFASYSSGTMTNNVDFIYPYHAADVPANFQFDDFQVWSTVWP